MLFCQFLKKNKSALKFAYDVHFDNFLFVQIHLDVFTCWRHLVIEAQSNCVVITQKDESKMAAIFRAYNRIMVKQPFLTQCVTCGKSYSLFTFSFSTRI